MTDTKTTVEQYIYSRVETIQDQQDDVGTIDNVEDRLKVEQLNARRDELQKLLREMDRHDW